MADRIVFAHLPGRAEAVPAGRLTMLEEGLRLVESRFSYGQRYRERADAFAVDPLSLPLDSAPGTAPFDGLVQFGALRDATPDAWGRRVIENRLRAPPDGLPEPVYLDLAGPHRAGALDVRGDLAQPPAETPPPPMLALEHLVDAAERIEEGEPVPAHLDVFFNGGPSVGGARPKAVVGDAGRQWVAKFPSTSDRFDVPAIERATLELARDAGLQVPAIDQRRLADGRTVMLIERFDRSPHASHTARRHMVSALTLLGRHESESPDASYAEIVRAMSRFGAAGGIAADREELFGRMVFNVLVTNDDDHLRNHAFLFDPAGNGWRLSPLFDVVPKPQIGTERFLHLSVGPQGRIARLDNAMAGAGAFGLLQPAAARIVDRIVRVVREWRGRFEALGVPVAQCDKIASAFPRAADIGMREVEKHL